MAFEYLTPLCWISHSCVIIAASFFAYAAIIAPVEYRPYALTNVIGIGGGIFALYAHSFAGVDPVIEEFWLGFERWGIASYMLMTLAVLILHRSRVHTSDRLCFLCFIGALTIAIAFDLGPLNPAIFMTSLISLWLTCKMEQHTRAYKIGTFCTTINVPVVVLVLKCMGLVCRNAQGELTDSFHIAVATGLALGHSVQGYGMYGIAKGFAKAVRRVSIDLGDEAKDPRGPKRSMILARRLSISTVACVLITT